VIGDYEMMNQVMLTERERLIQALATLPVTQLLRLVETEAVSEPDMLDALRLQSGVEVLDANGLPMVMARGFGA
jgi:hypothetical protein